MMKTAFLLGLLLACASAHDFSVCSGVTDELGISVVTFVPDPPAAGANLEIDITLKPTIAVTGGTATLKATAFGIVVKTVSMDVCTQLGLTCPLTANTQYTTSISFGIPSSAPAGITATAEVDVVDLAGNKLSCITMDAKLKAASLRANDLSSNKYPRTTYEYMFEAWRQQYNMDFDASEYVQRLQIFADATDYIFEHNSKDSTFKMAHNEYSYLTYDEFKTRMGLGTPMPAKPHTANSTLEYSGVELASSIDWVTKGAVTGVKDQGNCGGCWAFSSTGSIEGAGYIATGKLISLSEQMLIDCSDKYGNEGCSGGLMDDAFKYVKATGGLCSESAYPYTAANGQCQSSGCSIQSNSQVTGYTDVSKDENSLMEALSYNPVSVAIEADQNAFQYYSSGVMTGTCGTNLDHGVLAVGYGTMDSTDYWLVKNSWGASWGDAGYIYIERGSDECGILMSASYPKVSSSSSTSA